MRHGRLAMLLPVATLLAIAPAAAAQAATAASPTTTAASQATASQATASQATASQATASQATASQATASQATASQATASQAPTFTCYPSTPSSFDVSNSDVVNKEVTTTLADGTPIPGGFKAQSDPPYYPTKTSGPLVESFTNETTQKTIVRNDSGSSWFTYDPAPIVPGALATGTYVATGNNYELFGPLSEAALEAAGIHEPALVFTSSLLVMRFVITSAGAYVTSFSLHGTPQDGCALLAGRR